MSESPRPKKQPAWLMRTYSGHSSAQKSNELYRTNLAKGQTGLSIAFDLPTQTGYDADHPLSRGEVGKVGVPIAGIADMAVLFEGIPIEKMNTSMTINATAAWLLSLYIAVAETRGIDPSVLKGTTQNDIIKEYLSRGTYIFPPGPSMRLLTDVIGYTYKHIPDWNPMNVCSYHLQEAGATPVQEIAYAIGTGLAVLDAVREGGKVSAADLATVVGRISFFVNSGVRFIEEVCKMRAFTELWDELMRERYGVTDEKLRRFRYGVQVNSLGLTESQPENNVQRIVLEMLGVTLSRDARARAVQLPAWNEALGLPRPWDQQWSLRMQQVLAYETDLLEYEDIFRGSHVIEAKTAGLVAAAKEELARIDEQGGIVAAVESGFIKRELVQSHMKRLRAIERGELQIVGLNCFRETAESPLTVGGDGGILKVDPVAEREQVLRVQAMRAERNSADASAALVGLRDAVLSGENVMPASIRAAHAGVTTGEWGSVLREVFGEYRAPTGIDISTSPLGNKDREATLIEWVRETGRELGRPLKLLVGKPGLDGHSNGAEQIAVKARDVGFEVVYEGIRLTPAQIATAAEEEGVHLVGVSILSGSHLELCETLLRELSERGVAVPVIVGGIVPPDDARALVDLGVARVFTPKDADMNVIMTELVGLVRARNGLAPLPA